MARAFKFWFALRPAPTVHPKTSTAAVSTTEASTPPIQLHSTYRHIVCRWVWIPPNRNTPPTFCRLPRGLCSCLSEKYKNTNTKTYMKYIHNMCKFTHKQMYKHTYKHVYKQRTNTCTNTCTKTCTNTCTNARTSSQGLNESAQGFTLIHVLSSLSNTNPSMHLHLYEPSTLLHLKRRNVMNFI